MTCTDVGAGLCNEVTNASGEFQRAGGIFFRGRDGCRDGTVSLKREALDASDSNCESHALGSKYSQMG